MLPVAAPPTPAATAAPALRTRMPLLLVVGVGSLCHSGASGLRPTSYNAQARALVRRRGAGV